MTLAELRAKINDPKLDPHLNVRLEVRGVFLPLNSIREGATELYLRSSHATSTKE